MTVFYFLMSSLWWSFNTYALWDVTSRYWPISAYITNSFSCKWRLPLPKRNTF